MSTCESTQSSAESMPPLEEKRFRTMWGQLFGDASVQVYFADSELNARVYTLDSDSNYKVQHKKVGGTHPVDELEDPSSQRLAFPKKARRGEKHGRAQLDENDVRAIRAWAAGLAEKKETPTWTSKAKELNVSEGTLRDIVSRRTWTHLSSVSVNFPSKARLEDHDVNAIRDWVAEEELKEGGPDRAAKAEELKISDSHLRNIATRRTWTRIPGGTPAPPQNKLDEGDVRTIRDWAAKLKANNDTPDWSAKAKELNVSEFTIHDVVARRTWADLD